MNGTALNAMSPPSSLAMNLNSSVRVHSPAIATPALRAPKEVALRPNDQKTINDFNSIATTSIVPPSNMPTNTNPCTTQMSPKSIDTIDGSMSHGGNSNATTCIIGTSNTTKMTHLTAMIPERDTNGSIVANNTNKNSKLIPHRPITGPAKLTIQSTPVKSQPPMLSSNLSNQHKNHHASPSDSHMLTNGIGNGIGNQAMNGSDSNGRNHTETSQNLLNQFQKNTIIMRHHHGGTNEFRGLQRVQECHSSSDENRSSGHASMSDTGHSSPGCGGNRSNDALGPLPEDRLAAGVTNRSTRSSTSAGHSRARNRSTPAAKGKKQKTLRNQCK